MLEKMLHGKLTETLNKMNKEFIFDIIIILLAFGIFIFFIFTAINLINQIIGINQINLEEIWINRLAI